MTGTPAASPPTDPPGSRTTMLDLDGEVRLLTFPGPPGAPVLLCLHGLGGSALNFAALGPLLAATHEVVVLDLPAHGRSRPPAGADAAGDALAVLDGVLATFAGRPVTLVGASLGGVLAQRRLARGSAPIERLVLLDPPVPTTVGRAWDPRLTPRLAFLWAPGVGALVQRQMARTGPEETVRRQLAQATPHVDRVPAEVRAATVAETRWRDTRPDAAAARTAQWRMILQTLQLLSRPAAWQAELARIDVPVLWLQGADDLLAPVGHVRALAARLPAWSLRVRGGVGHLPHLEDPGWTAAQLREWLPA
ncbi:alpha/beta hydrolase [Modestobacter sp. NPDC049651]|uniref:alpha/beta fold hydrolase n=1 Tax=unclassified Modestobacter TaxID=2643866 RepID=UPI0033CB676D